MDIYAKRGYVNRVEYLESLAKEYGVNEDIVFAAASALGPEEDFDGLISTLENIEDVDFC